MPEGIGIVGRGAATTTASSPARRSTPLVRSGGDP